MITIMIVILIVINSYIIIKDNYNDNAQNKDNKKYLKKKKKTPCEWSFLTITITMTTNKTLITDKTLAGEGKKTIILIYHIPTMKRLPCLICSVNITFIKTKRDICL